MIHQTLARLRRDPSLAKISLKALYAFSFMFSNAAQAQFYPSEGANNQESSRAALDILSLIKAKSSDAVISKHESEIALDTYAECISKIHPRWISLFIRSVLGSALGESSAKGLVDSGCFPIASGGKMVIAQQSMRDALFPALYRSRFGKSGPPKGIADLPPLSLPTEFDDDVANLPTTYRVIRGFGDCVVRNSPLIAHALMVSKRYSETEGVALQDIQPALAKCVQEG